jgi:hypothetical protein
MLGTCKSAGWFQNITHATEKSSVFVRFHFIGL